MPQIPVLIIQARILWLGLAFGEEDSKSFCMGFGKGFQGFGGLYLFRDWPLIACPTSLLRGVGVWGFSA